MKLTCTLCGGPVVGYGFCNKHYMAWSKYGDPNKKLNARNEPFKNRYTVDEQTGCWVWIIKNPIQRYGWWKAFGEIKAHRASWVMHNGPVPDGMQVLHKCDNPRCVNPQHLFIGTQIDNMKDMSLKKRGRVSVGARNTNAKLNEAQVRLVRVSSIPNKQLAELLGVNANTIGCIKRRELWPHLL